MLRNLLTNVALWLIGVYKKFTTIPDYRIINVTMEYTLDNKKTYEVDNDFWELESYHWDGETQHYFTDITKRRYKKYTVPENVSKTVIRVKYWYNNQVYKYITENIDHAWPPKNNGFSFTVPYIGAWLADAGDKPIRDILLKIKRYAGPKNDFHGETVAVKDLLYYDDETLEREYPKIKVTNAIGIHKSLCTSNATTTNLRLI